MSGPSKLSLAIAMALIGGNAFALGLGSIQVKSGLNQPLEAEIPVTTDSPQEAAGLNVGLATTEDFERVGLSRARVGVPIDFSVSTNARGQAVIKLTTKDAVREPFLDFLIEVNWPKGKLLREYTVLLDPPVTAPSRSVAATVTPAKEATPAPAQKLAEEPQPKRPAEKVKAPRTAGTPEPKAAAAPKNPPASAPQRTAGAGDYGPVAEGETLSEVARATRPEDTTNLNQMMLALLKANPNAFYKDNINALKRGAILRIPSNDEIKATGSAAAVAAAVHDQNEAWSGNAAVAKPTVVASTGAPKSTTPSKADSSKPAPGERLALVPPRAGKEGSQSSSDRPGAATGTGASAADKAELARTKEALASREQEAAELKSRVKQLEDLNGKDQRLITLKDSEIADLQAKLKELQAKAGASAAAPSTAATAPKPVEPPPTASAAPKPAEPGKPGDKLTAQDIWGSIAAGEKNPAKPGATGAAAPTPSTGATGTAPTASSSTTPSTAATATAPSPSATSPATAAGPTGTTAVTSTPSTPANGGTTVAPVTTPSTTPPTSIAPSATPPKPVPAATKPVTPAPPPAPEEAWYENKMVQIGGGLLLVLIGAVALLRFMRKPKPVLQSAPAAVVMDEHFAPPGSEDEHHLLDALAQTPGDPHLSLELLTLYYHQRDAAKFEAAAEAMYAHIADPTQPEWQQVRAMGEELCPHNPLFSGGDMIGGAGHEHHADDTVFGHHAEQAGGDAFDFGMGETHESKPAEESFDFDLTDHSVAAPAPEHDLDFAHEPPPPPPRAPAPAPAFATAQAPAHAAAAVAPAPAPKPADDFFAGEDAIGTKLDLAKAYLDMGDPEGARSMLDEVMAEGNDSQKGEARKLLAEIR